MDSLYDGFKTYIKAQGDSYKTANQLALLETTLRDYPSLRALLRNRSPKSLMSAGRNFKTKFKSKVERNYGKRFPGTPVNFQPRGSLNFLETALAQEFGTIAFVEEEILTQSEGVWSDGDLAQKFDDIVDNAFQDMYVDRAEFINETIWRPGTAQMETGSDNEPRSMPQCLNEWETGHGTTAARLFPGVTTIEGQDPTIHGTVMQNAVERYSTVGEITGLVDGHLLTAFARGMRRVNFQPVPTAEMYTQGTTGPKEIFCSIEGCVLVSDTFAAHHHVIAEKGFDGTYMLASRLGGSLIVDEPLLDDAALYPAYTSGAGASTPDSGSAALTTYYTEMTSPNCIGPRFYLPYQPHVLPVWQRDNMMRESPIYSLEESAPDVMVAWTKNLRGLHFESMRRGLVVAPDRTITRYS